MRKIGLLIGLAFAAGVFLVGASSALAEFKSISKGTSGKSGYLVGNLEGGGAKVSCMTPETKEAPEWEIEKEGKASETGPSLHLKLKTWGGCESEVEGITKSVSSSACELEAKQPKEEETVSVTVLSTCSFSVELLKLTCEVKIEPEENSERGSLSLADSGAGDENSNLFFQLTGITTKVKGSLCELAGIKATHTGKLIGDIEAQQVAPGGPPASEFRLAFMPGAVGQIIGVGNSTNIQLINAQSVAVAGPGARFTTAEPGVTAVFFTVGTRTVAECAAFAFGANASCPMKVTFSRNSGITAQFINFQVVDPAGRVESRLSVGASRSLR